LAKNKLNSTIIVDLVDKITKFAETVSEFSFYPYEKPLSKRITRSLLLNEGATLTALFSRQSGKSTTVAATAAANMELLPLLAKKYEGLEMYEKGFWVGIFAPVGEQSATLFDKIYETITTETGIEVLTGELRMPIPAKGGGRGNLIKLSNGSLARMHSANRRAKINSKTYHLILLDESQELESFVVSTSIGPMGASVNATTVATGTPAPFVGFFYDQINTNKGKDAQANKSSLQLHFEADADEVKKHNKMYAKYLKKEIEKLGADSEEYLMSYMLKWPITKGMMFTKSQLKERCYRPNLKFVSTQRERPCVAGLDVGKAVDSTVLAILEQNLEKVDVEGNIEKILLDLFEIEGDDWEVQYPQIVDKLGNYAIETLVIDSTSLGDPVRERIAFMVPEITVVPFIFSPSTKDIGYKYLIKEINAGRLLVPYSSDSKRTKKFRKFEHQMCSLRKNYTGKFLNPKPVDDNKGHDDYPDALMIATYATYFDVMPEIEEDDGYLFRNSRVDYNIFGNRYSRPRRR
jgi:hypothetical protein